MDPYVYIGLARNHNLKILHEKSGGVISSKLLEKLATMEEWQQVLLENNQNPFVPKLVNFEGPFLYKDVKISKDFYIDDIAKNEKFKGKVIAAEIFNDTYFPQKKFYKKNGPCLKVGLAKEMGLTNQKLIELASKEPDCMDYTQFILRAVQSLLIESPKIFSQFSMESILVPIRSQHKIEGEPCVPILSLSKRLIPYWRPAPLNEKSKDGLVFLLSRP